jgi:hypothetical protein
MLPDGSVRFFPMPKNDADLWTWLTLLKVWREVEGIRTIICLEQVSGYIGGVGHPGSSMFRFGEGYGFLRGLLYAAGFRTGDGNLFLTPPQEWMRGLGLRKRCRATVAGWTKSGVQGRPPHPAETDTEWKNYLRQEASKRFPRLKVTLAVADALLIAAYCRQKFGGTDSATATV